ncbi:MAG: inositol monophosphatase [Planctomycetes bacterium]|nr:inositol monophosphatase [Planctomycetota bacterium]
MESTELHRYLSIAKEAASLAGSFLSERRPSSAKVNFAKGKDIKIAADVDSEKIIFKHLREHSPFSILSEEKGFLPGENKDYMWIVDPLDGTMNYLRNIPLCCVSIGLWYKRKPLLGVVNNFNTGELYSGIVGEGAWIGDYALAVSDIGQKQEAVFCTGFPVHTDFSQEALKNFIADIRLYKKIRMIGCAALSICYVASGKTEVYYERDIMLWDIAGGIPVVLGAGGRAHYDNALLENSYNVYISNGKLGKILN